MVGHGVGLLKEAVQLFVGAIAHGPQQDRHRQLALAIHLDRQDISLGRLELQPGTPVGDELGHAQLPSRDPILLDREVDARRADELADHHALCPVDDKGAVFGHQRKVAHKDVLGRPFVALFVPQGDPDVQGSGIGHVAVKAVLLCVLGFLKTIVQPKLLVDLLVQPGKVKLQVSIKALNRRDLVKELPQTLCPGTSRYDSNWTWIRCGSGRTSGIRAYDLRRSWLGIRFTPWQLARQRLVSLPGSESASAPEVGKGETARPVRQGQLLDSGIKIQLIKAHKTIRGRQKPQMNIIFTGLLLVKLQAGDEQTPRLLWWVRFRQRH